MVSKTNLLMLIAFVALASCTKKDNDANNEEGSDDNTSSMNESTSQSNDQDEVTEPPSILTSPVISNGTLTLTAGDTANITFDNSGGAVENYTISPALPSSLTINQDTGSITGLMPYVIPNVDYTLTAANSLGSTEVSFTLSVVSKYSGNLTLIDEIADGELDTAGANNVNYLRDSYGSAVSPDGKFLYFGSSIENAVTVMEIPNGGGLDYVQHELDGVNSSRLTGASDVRMTSDSKYLYVTGRTDNALSVWERDLQNGTLSFVEDVVDNGTTVDGLLSPTEILLTPDDKAMIVGNNNSEISHLTINADGTLTHIETFINGGDDGHGNTLAGIANVQGMAVTQDGRWVYYTSSTLDTLSYFSRNPTDGDLQYVKTYTDGGPDENSNAINDMENPKKMFLSPDGNQLYVANDDGNSISIFQINLETGGLTQVQTILHTGLDAAGATVTNFLSNRGATLSPDGAFVIGHSDSANNIHIFSRDKTTGELTRVNLFTDGGTDSHGATLNRLTAMRYVTFSPDGKYLFAFADGTEESVTIFQFDEN